MKVLAILLLSFSTFAALGASVSETIKKIEMDENARCEFIVQGHFKLCTGVPTPTPFRMGDEIPVNTGAQNTCRFTVHFSCVSN